MDDLHTTGGINGGHRLAGFGTCRVAPGSMSDVLIIDSGGNIVAANPKSAGVCDFWEGESLTDDYIYMGRCTINSDSAQPHLILFVSIARKFVSLARKFQSKPGNIPVLYLIEILAQLLSCVSLVAAQGM